jgi:hypothetical protein
MPTVPANIWASAESPCPSSERYALSGPHQILDPFRPGRGLKYRGHHSSQLLQINAIFRNAEGG